MIFLDYTSELVVSFPVEIWKCHHVILLVMGSTKMQIPICYWLKERFKGQRESKHQNGKRKRRIEKRKRRVDWGKEHQEFQTWVYRGFDNADEQAERAGPEETVGGQVNNRLLRGVANLGLILDTDSRSVVGHC